MGTERQGIRKDISVAEHLFPSLPDPKKLPSGLDFSMHYYGHSRKTVITWGETDSLPFWDDWGAELLTGHFFNGSCLVNGS